MTDGPRPLKVSRPPPPFILQFLPAAKHAAAIDSIHMSHVASCPSGHFLSLLKDEPKICKEWIDIVYLRRRQDLHFVWCSTLHLQNISTAGGIIFLSLSHCLPVSVLLVPIDELLCPTHASVKNMLFAPSLLPPATDLACRGRPTGEPPGSYRTSLLVSHGRNRIREMITVEVFIHCRE